MNEDYFKKYTNTRKKKTKPEPLPKEEEPITEPQPDLMTLLNIKIVPSIPLKEIIHNQKKTTT